MQADLPRTPSRIERKSSGLHGVPRLLTRRRTGCPKGQHATVHRFAASYQFRLSLCRHLQPEEGRSRRPGRSQHNALDALSVAITGKKVNWILDADIEGFSILPDNLFL